MKINISTTLSSNARVEMIPLIDVIFLVLAAFIYATMFMTQKTGLPIELPEARTTQIESARVLTVAITEEGGLYLDDAQIELHELEDALLVRWSNNPNTSLYIVADRDARLTSLVEVMDLARRTGITDLTIATRRELDPIRNE